MMKDNRDGHLPYCNGTVIEYKRVLEDLQGFAVECWPWIDLVILRLGFGVFDVRDALQAKFKTEVPLRHLDDEWRRITFAEGRHQFSLFYRKDHYINKKGKGKVRWKGYIKLTDNPPLVLQQKIADLLNHCRCRWWLSELELAIDVIPVDFSSFGSTVRRYADPLTVAAATSRSKRVPQALVDIQDVVDRYLHVPHSRIGSKGSELTTSYRGKDGHKNRGSKGRKSILAQRILALPFGSSFAPNPN